MLPSWMTLSAADALGAAAFVGSCLWPMLKNRRALLIGQALANVLFIAHFLLLGAYTAAALCGLVVTQALGALPERRGLLQKALFTATVPGIALIAWGTWAGLPSALSSLGISFSTAARWQSDTTRMRWLLLAAGVFWVSHNALVMSPFAMAADGMAAVANIARLVAGRRKGAPTPVGTPVNVSVPEKQLAAA